MGARIKKEDTVLVLTGKESGKRGRVISVMPKEGKLLVERVNIIKKHMKPSRKNQQGGIIEREGPLHISKVMLVCPKCSAPTRMGVTVFDDGRRARTCKKCKEVI